MKWNRIYGQYRYDRYDRNNWFDIHGTLTSYIIKLRDIILLLYLDRIIKTAIVHLYDYRTMPSSGDIIFFSYYVSRSHVNVERFDATRVHIRLRRHTMYVPTYPVPIILLLLFNPYTWHTKLCSCSWVYLWRYSIIMYYVFIVYSIRNTLCTSHYLETVTRW